MRFTFASFVVICSGAKAYDTCNSFHGTECTDLAVSTRKTGVWTHGACCQACQGQAGCRAWSWNFKAGHCYLKQSCHNQTSNLDYHSGMTDQSYSRLTDATDSIRTVAFSPNSKWLATSSEDGMTRLYLLHESKGTPQRPTLQFTIKGVDPQRGVAFSADSNWLVCGSAGWKYSMYAINGSSPVLVHTFGYDSGLGAVNFAVAFSGDSKWLATASSEGMDLYELRSGETPKFKFALKTQTDIAFSGDSKWLITGNDDGLISLYKIEEFGLVLRHALTHHCLDGIAVSKDSKWIASSSSTDRCQVQKGVKRPSPPHTMGDVRVYAWENGSIPSLRYNLNVSGAGANAVAFSGDSKSVVTSWGDDNWDGDNRVAKLRVYALDGSSPTLQFESKPSDSSDTIAFSEDSKWLASAGLVGGAVQVYFLQSRAPMKMREMARLIV